MGGSTFLGEPRPALAQKAAQRLAAEGKALHFAMFRAKVVIVEASIGGASQVNGALADSTRQAARAGATAVGMRQSRLSLLPQTLLETFDMTKAEREQFGGSGACHFSLSAPRNYAHSLHFLLTQRECPSSHASHGGDIFTLLLGGDRTMEPNRALCVDINSFGR
jgi:hypothetical protein